MGRYAGHDRHPHLSRQAMTAAVVVGGLLIWGLLAAVMATDAHGHERHGRAHGAPQPRVVHVSDQQGPYSAQAWVMWRGDRVQLVRVYVAPVEGVQTRVQVQVLDGGQSVWQETVTRRSPVVVLVPRTVGSEVVVRYGWPPSQFQLWAVRP